MFIYFVAFLIFEMATANDERKKFIVNLTDAQFYSNAYNTANGKIMYAAKFLIDLLNCIFSSQNVLF